MSSSRCSSNNNNNRSKENSSNNNSSGSNNNNNNNNNNFPPPPPPPLSTTKAAAATTLPTPPPPPQQQHHEPRTHSNQYLWRHEPRRRLLALLCEAPHPGARDEVEVSLPGGVEEGHGALGLVVGGDAERDDLKVVQAGGHGQDLE